MLALQCLTQIGGVYLQAFSTGDYVVASRIGGLQLFHFEEGVLIPKASLSLTSIPLLVKPKESHDIIVVFKKAVFKVCITSEEKLSLCEYHSDSFQYKRPFDTAQIIKTNKGEFLLDRQNKLVVNLTTKDNLRLPGYSRPSTISLSENGQFLFVADVGRIHCIKVDDMSFALGYSAPGWPKDIFVVNDNVFVANVYGISWFKEVDVYPFLKLHGKIAFPHFRIAKVIACQNNVFACDEARGVHIFAMKDNGLYPAGGMMCAGGGWDCIFIDYDLYIASGNEGWCQIKNYSPDKSLFTPDYKQKYENERVQAISFWKQENAIVVLSSGHIRVIQRDDYSELFELEANAWGGCEVSNRFLVATENGIIALEANAQKQITLSESIPLTEARDICYDGIYIWVASGKGGIKCFTIETGRLQYQGTFPVCGFSRGIFATSKRLYVGAGDGGLVAIKKG